MARVRVEDQQIVEWVNGYASAAGGSIEHGALMERLENDGRGAHALSVVKLANAGRIKAEVKSVGNGQKPVLVYSAVQ